MSAAFRKLEEKESWQDIENLEELPVREKQCCAAW